ncbi:MAG: diguanylate cyclase [Fibrobacterales bacterium]
MSIEAPFDATILVVDDVSINTKILKKILVLNGYHVIIALNAEDAVRIANQTPPDLVMLDINMPDVDGYELSMQMKTNKSLEEIPIIFISASTDTHTIVKAFDSGGVDYVTKPIERREVLARVKVHLELQKIKRELLITNKKLQQLAITDELTQTYNRRNMIDRLRDAFSYSDRYKTDVSVLMVDLDYFKRVNDSFGHNAGDAVLSDVSKVMKEMVRDSDVVGRWGGEEFVLIFPHTNIDGALEVSEKIRRELEERSWAMTQAGVTISGGLVQHQRGEAIDDCINRADILMYKAKEAGRNRIVLE